MWFRTHMMLTWTSTSTNECGVCLGMGVDSTGFYKCSCQGDLGREGNAPAMSELDNRDAEYQVAMGSNPIGSHQIKRKYES